MTESRENSSTVNHLHFLAGDGEIATLLRTTDWSKTAVGPVGSWPRSLRMAVQIILTSRYSMFVAWGRT